MAMWRVSNIKIFGLGMKEALPAGEKVITDVKMTVALLLLM